MISFDEAQKLLDRQDVQIPVEKVSTAEADGRVLAESIRAREPNPRFRKSAMDGYAVRSADLAEASDEHPVELVQTGTVSAGHPVSQSVSPGETMRIFTGAPVPDGADAVVMQEKVEALPGRDAVRFSQPATRTNIRPEGEELEQGEQLFEKQYVLSPSGVGLLLEQGYTDVPVFELPQVSIVNTGDELVPADQTPVPGEVRDSIGPALSALVRREGIDPERHRVADDRDRMVQLFERTLDRHDVVFVSGGVSVGKRDLTRDVLTDRSVEPVFHGVRQKPGKPVFLGRRDETIVLGLPGNPVSSLVCYYLYGRPILRAFAGNPTARQRLPRVRSTVDDESEARPERTVFIRARSTLTEGRFESRSLEHQGSHMLSGLAAANSLVRLPPTDADGIDHPLAYLLPEQQNTVFS